MLLLPSNLPGSRCRSCVCQTRARYAALRRSLGRSRTGKRGPVRCSSVCSALSWSDRGPVRLPLVRRESSPSSRFTAAAAGPSRIAAGGLDDRAGANLRSALWIQRVEPRLIGYPTASFALQRRGGRPARGSGCSPGVHGRAAPWLKSPGWRLAPDYKRTGLLRGELPCQVRLRGRSPNGEQAG